MAKRNTLADRALTGIAGFDAMTGGGLPAGRTTLISGEAGAGKSVFALQTLVGGARRQREPGIFVAFEEHSERIVTNAASFGWDLPALQKEGLFFLDAQPSPHLIQSGEFELTGMLSALDAKIREMGARRIVFDAIDVVLALIDDPVARRKEVYRLHDWLIENKLTGVITAKQSAPEPETGAVRLDFIQFMVDCYVRLAHECEFGVSQRSLRILKYRGTGFEENETPLVIDKNGMEVAYTQLEGHTHSVSTERVSTGVERLDTMLDGGYHRASSILVTGSPGTAKTTLGAAFASASCKRGEKTVFVTFDSPAEELVRNLASVGIDLQVPSDEGLLRLVTARSIRTNAEHHLMEIRRMTTEHGATCLVVDPLSALARRGDSEWSNSVVERLIDWTRSQGITLLCTSLLNQKSPDAESTPLQISTIADTWIHLNYMIHGGERNRGLTIVKSRGTRHSNQVREMILSGEGVTLEDVYTAEGEVLMGTLRFEREKTQALAERKRQLERQRHEIQLENDSAELEANLQAIERKLAFKREEMENLKEQASKNDLGREALHQARQRRRGADHLGDDPDTDRQDSATDRGDPADDD